MAEMGFECKENGKKIDRKVNFTFRPRCPWQRF